MNISELGQHVLTLLNQHPGQNAREIASALNVDKSQVNSVLYGELRGKVERGDNYKWWLSGAQPSVSERSTETPDANTPLSKLCRYYLDCIDQESALEATCYASNRYGNPDYIELPKHPLVEDFDPFLLDQARSMWGRIRTQRSQVLCLGHPVLLTWIRIPNRDPFAVLEPVFLHFISSDDGRPIIENVPPSINQLLLKRLGGEQQSVLEQTIELAEELGLTLHLAELPEYDDVIARLHEKHPEWPWQENPDPHRLTQESALAEVQQDGIYNRAILLPLERQQYTIGLETELGALRKVQDNDYRETTLGKWIFGYSTETPPPSSEEVLLEASPLNSEQRSAVHSALTQPLTVVTGPPGTGKSQVVSAILVNAAWRGMSVLFSSKNNKAVSVVEQRVNSLGRRPILLRTGKKEHYAELSEYLTQLLSQSCTEEDIENFNRHRTQYKELLGRLQKLDQQLDEIVKQRNRVDELDQIVDGWRINLSVDQITVLKSWNLAEVSNRVTQLRQILDRCWKEKVPVFIRWFWRWLKKNRYKRLNIWGEQNRAIFEPAGVAIHHIQEDTDPDLSAWEEVYAFSQERIRQAKAWQELVVELTKLTNGPSLEDISRKRASMVPELELTSQRLWDLWLNVQPSRLSKEHRQLLSRFNALLRLMSKRRNQGGKVAREFHQLFPEASKQLSCWAVTALSARNRIPLQPGFFDLLIIDEASQCDIASAIPLLLRAKRAVIIGDPLQLRHITSLTAAMDGQLLEKHELIPEYSEWSYSENSLYDLATSRVASSSLVVLRDHFRSHADIIEFSNQFFYDGRLRVATPYDRLKRPYAKGPAVRWIDVKGKLRRPRNGGAENKKEALAVVDELKRLVLDQGYPGSVGVVTPFRAHANLINQMVAKDDQLLRRLSTNEFLCDVVHSFQGDERDVMIFSPVISEGTTRGASWFLGSSPNLFNVAVTRAKAALIVIGDRSAANNQDIKYLKKFAGYVHNIETKLDTEEISESPDLGPDYPIVAQPELVSDWERYFYRVLYNAGIRPVPQVPVEKYILDFALYAGDRRLDIEVDGETYHRNWNGELCRRDQLRNLRLIELGWDVMRFWVYQIREQPDKCVAQIFHWLKPQPS